MNSEYTVLVTGFGPFKDHDVNASWEAVKKLYDRRDELRERYNVNLIIDRLPVQYDRVTERVPELWKEHDPRFLLHVGVSREANCLKIEERAHGIGYVRADIEGKCPTTGGVTGASDSVLDTGIDVHRLCRKLNDGRDTAADRYGACVSRDAGRYLCEYTYHQSLSLHPQRTLFVHVPDSSVYSSQLTATGLYDVIALLVQQAAFHG